MKKAIVVPLLVCSWAIATAAHAEGWSPFRWLDRSHHDSQAVTRNVSGSSQTPTILAKMKGGTRRFVNNTKSLFTPEKPPVKRRGVTATHRAQRPEPPKQSFFDRMFNPQPVPPPKTVGEWMSLDQVRP